MEAPRPEDRRRYEEAIQGLGTVAAPLLAGFSLTLVVYTLTATAAFRWPNAVLVLILAAALSLITSVQCAMVARLYGAGRQAAHGLWARRAERTYNAGILLLLAGITAALVPPAPVAEMGGRLAAIGVGLLGLAVAALWIASAYLPERWVVRRLLEGAAAEEGFAPASRVAVTETAEEEA